MANIKQATALAALQHTTTKVPQQKRTALQIAARVFQLAAQAGHPFEKISQRAWAQQWLMSDTFVLMEIPTARVALTSLPKNQNRVLEYMHASADSQEPIVVDTNKQGIGKSYGGYVPSVIVVDGKHRHRGTTLAGRGTIMAWVGTKALPKMTITACALKMTGKPFSKKTKLETAALLSNIPRQDVAQNGSAPHAPMPGVKAGKLYASDPSDVTPHHDPSDRKDKPFGRSLDPSDTDRPPMKSPSRQAPGAGVGPRMAPSKGGSKSDMQSLLSAADVKQMWGDCTKAMKAGKFKFVKQMMGKTPPGCESFVKGLKDHPEIDNPYALAWYHYNEHGGCGGGKK